MNPARGAFRGVVATILLMAMMACEEAGPADYLSVVEGGAAAAVVELTGEGIIEVESVGTTRVIARPSSGPATWRVILVSPVAAPLRFLVSVRDGSRPPPNGRVLEATDGANEPLSVSGLRVRLEGA